jgi:hypothetical protein
MKRVEAVADGRTINGTYKKPPDVALDEFRTDLKLLVEALR